MNKFIQLSDVSGQWSVDEGCERVSKLIVHAVLSSRGRGYMDKDFVITFQNTNFAVKAERALLDEKLSVGVLPLPTQISAGCGICLKVFGRELESALAVLEAVNVGKISIYSREMENNRYVYSEC